MNCHRLNLSVFLSTKLSLRTLVGLVKLAASMSNETFHSRLRMEVEWGTLMDRYDRMDISGTCSKTLKCPKCNWRYVREKHREGEETTCFYCTTGARHHSRKKTYACGYKPHKCEICNYSTASKSNLKVHMKSDTHLNNVQLTIGGQTPNDSTQS